MINYQFCDIEMTLSTGNVEAISFLLFLKKKINKGSTSKMEDRGQREDEPSIFQW